MVSDPSLLKMTTLFFVFAPESAIQVAAGDGHSLLLTEDGQVHACGRGLFKSFRILGSFKYSIFRKGGTAWNTKFRGWFGDRIGE